MKRPTWTITWVDEMSVGITEIDEDHKRFISLIHEFNRSITDRMTPSEIKNRLQIIVDDAERHFKLEEKLFKEWKYPDTVAHSNTHAKVLNELKVIMDEFVPYGHDSSWVDAGLRVKTILINHILLEDMMYARFYQKSRSAAVAQNA